MTTHGEFFTAPRMNASGRNPAFLAPGFWSAFDAPLLPASGGVVAVSEMVGSPIDVERSRHDLTLERRTRGETF
jgi:hypothetical protein